MVEQQSLLAEPDSSPTVHPRVAYKSERCTLYAGDCADLVGKLPTVDLLCTDPPYGVRWDSGRNGGRFGPLLGDDGSLDVPGVLGALTRTHLRQNRHAYIFGFRPEQLAEPLRLGAHTELIWDKAIFGPGDLSQPWAPQHETVTFGVYVPNKAHRAANHGALAARMRTGSILRVPRKSGVQVTRHSTEKPVLLMRQMIESSSRNDELVLDPFAGSGSTLVAALLTGRRAIGCELDERYVQVAIDRLREAEKIADRIAAA